MDYFETLIHRAACAATLAATACRDWENGGDADPVSDTAWEAAGATLEALEAAAGIWPRLARVSMNRLPSRPDDPVTNTRTYLLRFGAHYDARSPGLTNHSAFVLRRAALALSLTFNRTAFQPLPGMFLVVSH